MTLLTILPLNHERVIGVAILALGLYLAVCGVVAWWSTR